VGDQGEGNAAEELEEGPEGRRGAKGEDRRGDGGVEDGSRCERSYYLAFRPSPSASLDS
jgi:hypothetical protein